MLRPVYTFLVEELMVFPFFEIDTYLAGAKAMSLSVDWFIQISVIQSEESLRVFALENTFLYPAWWETSGAFVDNKMK